MALTRRIARPMLASVFVASGVDVLRHPESRVKQAEPVTSMITKAVPSLPDNTELLVRVNAGAQVGAGALLALGRAPRLSAAVLAGTLVPTTLAGHRFWEEVDPVKRKQQQTHFLKNLSMLGALILATFDTEGAPSLTWRAKRAARRAAELTAAVHETGGGAKAPAKGRRAKRRAEGAARQTRAATKAAAHDARAAARKSRRRAERAAGRAKAQAEAAALKTKAQAEAAARRAEAAARRALPVG